MVEQRKIFAGVIAFLLGASLFTLMRAEISPVSDLHVRLVGIDTDLGVTSSRAEAGGLAERNSWTQTQIWVDPDLDGEEMFTIQIGADDFSGGIDRAVCGQPDIIATLTEPVPIVHTNVKTIKHQGQTYELHKTTWEIMLKTLADVDSANVGVGEINYKVIGQIGLTGLQITPPFGDDWEGNVYVEYEVTNIPGAFIYEVYINKDPRVGVISGDGIDQNLVLYAGDVPAEAAASYETMDAISFYDSIDGQQISDFKNAMTNRGVMLLGGKLSVGADAIMEEHTWPLHDEFKGWNLYNTAIQYQIATVIAIPVEEGTNNIVDPDTGEPTGETTDDIEGSQREEEQGDPQYYRTNVKDTKSFFDKLLGAVASPFGGITDTLKLIIFAIFTIFLIIVFAYILIWIMPRRR